MSESPRKGGRPRLDGEREPNGRLSRSDARKLSPEQAAQCAQRAFSHAAKRLQVVHGVGDREVGEALLASGLNVLQSVYDGLPGLAAHLRQLADGLDSVTASTTATKQ